MHAKALGKSEHGGVEVLLKLMSSVSMGFGVDLIIRVDDLARVTLDKDVSRLDLAVDQPSGFDQVGVESGDVLYNVAVSSGSAVKDN